MSTRSRTLLALVAVSSTACFLPPDPAEPVSDRARVGTEPRAGSASAGPDARRDSLVDGAWRPAAAPGSTLASASLTPRLASALSVGTWLAEVEPPGPEQLPDVSLWLNDLVLPGDVAGAAEYRFDGYRCRYALYVDEVQGTTVRLRQRLEEGRCAGPGRIILAWEDGESLVGDWVRPDGTRWFRAVLSRADDASAVPGSGRGPGAEPGLGSGGEDPERVP